jgi:tetratricopeptide (TPR) repeat protein
MSRSTKPAPGTREELLDEAEYVRKSLDDLDREHAAGELDGADYEALRARYEERSATIEVALVELDAAVPDETDATGTPTRARRPGAKGWLATRRHRMVFGWSAAGCFALAGVLVGLSLAGVAPFASAPPTTLTVAARIRIELAEAGVLASNKQFVQAVAVYDRVLELDPDQPEALANGGWLVRLAGISAKSARVIAGGDAEIAAAVDAAPAYPLARAYDGVALYEDAHKAQAAAAQFEALLADHPSATLLGSVRSTARAAYHAAKLPVPTEFAVPPTPAG